MLFILILFSWVIWPLIFYIFTKRANSGIFFYSFIGFLVCGFWAAEISIFCVPKAIVGLPNPGPYFNYIFLWIKWGWIIGSAIGTCVGHKSKS